MACFGTAISYGQSLEANTATPQLFELGLQNSLIYTDNVGASASNARSDWVAEITPSLRVRRDHGRLTGGLVAQFRTLTFANEDDRNTAYLMLSGQGGFEAIRNTLFIDADARMGRENRSAFAGRDESGELDVDEENEIRTFRIGPRLQFRPFGDTDAVLSYKHQWLSGGGGIQDREIGVVDASLKNPHAYGPWGWDAEYQREMTHYDNDELDDVVREEGRVRGLYAVTPRIILSVHGGWERNDFGAGDVRDDTIYGAGFGWRPSPRTSLVGVVEERFFGTGYHLDFSHRRARTRWHVTALRQVASAADEYYGVQGDALYQRFYDELSMIADPAAREEEAMRRAQEAVGGAGPFSTNHYFVSQDIGLGLTWSGRRTVVALNARQGHRTRLGQVISQDERDDLNTFDKVETRSLSLSINRRVSPNSTAHLTASYRESEGRGDNPSETERLTVGMGVSTRLGQNTTGGLRYQHHRTEGRGAARDYEENTLTANLGLRF